MQHHLFHGGFEQVVDVGLEGVGDVLQKSNGLKMFRRLNGESHCVADRLVET